jgi:hypothetical protein
VWSTGVDAHVICVCEACPKCRDLDRSPIFWALELLNTIYDVYKWSTGGICTSSFVQDNWCGAGVHLNCSTPQRVVFFGYWCIALSFLWLNIVHYIVLYVEMAVMGRCCVVWKSSQQRQCVGALSCVSWVGPTRGWLGDNLIFLFGSIQYII